MLWQRTKGNKAIKIATAVATAAEKAVVHLKSNLLQEKIRAVVIPAAAAGLKKESRELKAVVRTAAGEATADKFLWFRILTIFTLVLPA